MDIDSYNLAELAQTLFEESGDALLLFDPDNEQVLDVNPMAQRLTGCSRAALLRQPLHHLFRSETPGGMQRLRQACRKTGLFHSQEGFLIRHEGDGAWVPVNLTVTRLHAEPKTLGMITARDISERRATQARLEKTEADLRQLLASVSDSLWSVQVEPDGRWTACYCSPVVERITGWPTDRFQSGRATRLSVLHPQDRSTLHDALLRLQHGKSESEEVEYRVVRPDGGVRWMRDSILARRRDDRAGLRLDGILTDITERKKEENLLNARRGVLELIARGAPLADVLDRLVRAIEEQSPDRFASVLLLEGGRRRIGAAPNLPPVLRAALEVLPLPEHEVFRRGPWRHLCEPGTVCGLDGCWCRPILAPGAEAGGRREAVLGLIVLHLSPEETLGSHELNLLDLAGQLAAIAIERHRVEEVVRTTLDRTRSLIENLEQCVFLKDSEYRFVAVNAPFCRAVGRSEEEILGRSDFDFYPPELACKFREDDRKVLLESKRIDVEEQSLVAGQPRIVRVVKTPVGVGVGRPGSAGVLGIFWDVTEQRSLEAQLRQSQKMEAIGQLAGGVAHDFNNLLTAILGNLSLLSGTVALDPGGREMLKAAEAAAFRAANLTSQLLGFARRTLLRPEPVSLNSLIDEVVSLLRRTIDPRIHLTTTREDDLWPVLADAGHINQVLMNLCLNARDAMPQGGDLLLATRNVVLGPDRVQHQLDARSGEFVCLNIRDTGCGMTEEVKAHLYEPFYTTKGLGKGTGLGLATVFGIVKQHHGWIECDSEEGVGTAFRIYLPRHCFSGEMTGVSEAVGQEGLRLQGSETLLFVDDEPTLRNLGKAILERHGYTVLLASDGREAVEVFQREEGKIDLVILDLTMPRLSGRDTFRELRQIDEQVRVLFASGYSAEQLTPEEQEQIAGFVAKPYRPRELAAIVRETLDRQAGERGT